MKKLPTDMDNRQNSVNIESDEPFCIAYSDGKAKITKLPTHGETKVITHQGKVKRVKFDEGGRVLKVKSWVLLYIISIVVLVSGVTVIIIGSVKQDIALTISGVGLFGSFVGMFASASNTKAQYDKQRPYLVLRTNEDRYSMLQLEIRNLGMDIAVIEDLDLDKELPIISGGTLKENVKNIVVEGGGNVMFPYIIYGNDGYNNHYVDVTGTVKYKDLAENRYSNVVKLNMSKLTTELAHKQESLKRDHEIIKNLKYLETISENIKQ